MYNKIKSGGANYDIIIPSDYMIERMIDENMLEKINFDNIPNYKNIIPKYKDLYFDPKNEYSVPYNVGMVGLVYNTKMVEGTPDSWSIMWDEKYKGQVLMFNNSRDAFGIAQFLLGIDVNTTSEQDWKKAYQKLKEQKPVVQSYVMDDVFNKMEGGEAAIAAYYAGDCIGMAENNPDLAFVYPKEGTNIFVDSICIPKGCQNKDAAELYINFLLRGATEYFHNLDSETLMLMTSLWDNLKIEGNDVMSVYIGLITFAVIVVVYFIYRTIRKKKRESMY